MKIQNKRLENSKGFITLDFIFASVIFFVFSSILFSFSFTFSVVEVIQYVSFSSARSYSLGDINQNLQVERGQNKFAALTGSPTLRPLIENGWFELGDLQLADFNSQFIIESDQDAETFAGAIIPFNAPILYKRLPLLGTTASNPDGFIANIQSFTGREPTLDECRRFAGSRANSIQGEYPRSNPNGFFVQTDNGC